MPPMPLSTRRTTAGTLLARALLITVLFGSLAVSAIGATTADPTTPRYEQTPAVDHVDAPAVTTTSPGLASPPDDESDGTEHPMCQHYGENGLAINVSAALFSRDVDQLDGQGYTRVEYIEHCGHEPTWATNRTLEFDYTSMQAFPQVGTWNRRDVGDVPFPTPRGQVSLHPEGESTYDAGYLKDATASVFAVTPSVALRDEARGGTTLLIRDNTTIHGTQSYRTQLPRGLNDTSGRTHVTYDVERHRVVGACLLDGDYRSDAGTLHENESATLCRSHTPLATGAGLNTGGPHDPAARRNASLSFTYTTAMNDSLSYVATFEFRLQRTETVCTDWNGTSNTCNGTYVVEEFSETSQYTSAVDHLDVEYYSQPTPTAEVARYPNGSTEFILEARNTYGYRLGWDALFSGVRFPDSNTQAGWTWRVFSAERPSWRYLVNDSRTTRTRARSPAHPLQNYAIPVATTTEDATGTRLSTQGAVRVQDILRSSPAITTPSIDDNILISAPEPQYRLPYAVVYESPHALDFSRAEVIGLLNGTNTTGVYVQREVDIRATNLSATVERVNDTHLRATVSLAGIRGTANGQVETPLSTRSTLGYVVVNGERIQTGADGTATVTVRDAAYVDVRYEPAGWKQHRRNVGYLSSAQSARVPDPGAGFLLQLVSELILLFFPFLLVLVTLRHIARNNPEQIH